jgi:hypothetical protein
MITKESYDIVKKIWERWKKVDNSAVTYCNMFVSDVCEELIKYEDLKGLTANKIYELLLQDDLNWSEVKLGALFNADIEEQRKLIETSLIIAAQQGEKHGHVCILIPSEFRLSGKFGKYIPMCANIGKSNFYDEGVSWAFKAEPKYFIYKGEKNV